MENDLIVYVFLPLFLILLIIINLIKILAETPIIELEKSILTERVFTSKKEFLEEFVRLHTIDLGQIDGDKKECILNKVDTFTQTMRNAYNDYCEYAKERNVTLIYNYPSFAKYIRKYFKIDTNVLNEKILLRYMYPKAYLNDNVGWEYEE